MSCSWKSCAPFAVAIAMAASAGALLSAQREQGDWRNYFGETHGTK